MRSARSLEDEASRRGASISRARRGPDDVVRLVAAAVDARGTDPLARAIARLRDGTAVLLLDECEPVVAEAARVAAAVLAECPDVRVLATSREVLHVPGEVRVAVEPLALPDPASDDACPRGAAVRRPRTRGAPAIRADAGRRRDSSRRSVAWSTACRSRSSSPPHG